jgi:glycyl-tRNA synthetase beta chain
LKTRLKEPAEVALAKEIEERWPKIEQAQSRELYADAMKVIVGLRGPVDRFFTDVLVMAEDPQIREDRLALLTMLRDTITQIADISEMAAEEGK